MPKGQEAMEKEQCQQPAMGLVASDPNATVLDIISLWHVLLHGKTAKKKLTKINYLRSINNFNPIGISALTNPFIFSSQGME